MQVIDDFIKEYNKQYWFYDKLSKIVADIIDKELKEKGIRAIVTSRAKSYERLKDKLIMRNKDKNYQCSDDITEDIVDLSGVRIALYFPNDREKVDVIIRKKFECLKVKSFPENSDNPSYKKRFSGYWATHYRVKIKENTSSENLSEFYNGVTEIQVASVLMHGWSEVEHDLAYKPLNGTLSEEEYSILDELNGLVMAGEIALERLQKAGEKRIKDTEKLKNQYELSNLIYSSVKNQSKIDTGNLEKLYFLLDNFNENNTKKLEGYLSNIDTKKPISNEIIKKVIYGDEKKYDIWFNQFKNKNRNNYDNLFIKYLSEFENSHNHKLFGTKDFYTIGKLKDKLLFDDENLNSKDSSDYTSLFKRYLSNDKNKKR